MNNREQEPSHSHEEGQEKLPLPRVKEEILHALLAEFLEKKRRGESQKEEKGRIQEIYERIARENPVIANFIDVGIRDAEKNFPGAEEIANYIGCIVYEALRKQAEADEMQKKIKFES